MCIIPISYFQVSLVLMADGVSFSPKQCILVIGWRGISERGGGVKRTGEVWGFPLTTGHTHTSTDHCLRSIPSLAPSRHDMDN